MLRNRFKTLFLLLLLIGASGTSSPSGLQVIKMLGKPSLPAWISSVSPLEEASTLTQIRLVFTENVAPLSALSDATSSDFLDHLSIQPKLPGRFVLLTPRMIGFVPARALPLATRIRVTLAAGAHDLAGDTLAHNLAWTFQSTPITLTELPQISASSNGADLPVSLRPMIRITSNAALDVASLSSHSLLVASDTGARVALYVSAPKATAFPGSAETFDSSVRAYSYILHPVHDLVRGTTYMLRISPGVMPRDGNLATTVSAVGSLRTFGPLMLLPRRAGVQTYQSRFVHGDPILEFSNPIDPASFERSISISPAIPLAHRFRFGYNATIVGLDPYLLSPDTTYSITITTALHDIFKQHLDHSVVQTIQTGDFVPGIWAPTVTAIIPSDLTPSLTMLATNLRENAYRAAFIPISLDAFLRQGDFYSNDVPMVHAMKNWPVRKMQDARKNIESRVIFPIASVLGRRTGMIAYGIAAHHATTFAPAYKGLVQLSNLDVFSQIFPKSGIVRVTRFSDGAPAAGIAIDVHAVPDPFSSSGRKPICASGKTGSDGAFRLSKIQMERCISFANASPGAPSLLVIARDGADWSYSVIDNYFGTYEYDIPSSWTSGAPLSRGALYPDRDLYKPGESGELTGIAYVVQGDHIRSVPKTRYTVQVSDQYGKRYSSATVTTDSYGVFSLPIKIGTTARLGSYSIRATGPAGDVIDGSYRVAEFRAPNFDVALEFASPTVLAGATQRAVATGRYLFGGALSGAKAVVGITRDRAALWPPGYGDYVFGPQWFWPQREPSMHSFVSRSTGTLDSRGKISLHITVPDALPFPLTYRVEVEATDASNVSINTTQTFTALADPEVIGLSSDAVAKAGAILAVQTVVVTPDGKSAGTRAVHVVLQKATFSSQVRHTDTGDVTTNSVAYTTIDSQEVQAGAKAVAASLHPTIGGIYRIRATFVGVKSPAAATDLQVWVAGKSGNFFTQNSDRTVTVKLDRKKYRVGDHAVALVLSPYRHARITLDIIRNSVIYEATVTSTGPTASIPFTITPSMLPNAVVEVRVVRIGRSISMLSKRAIPTKLTRIGMTGLVIDVADHRLRLAVMPVHLAVKPGERQKLTFTLTSANGRPTSGELVVAVVNDAVLQLTGYRPPNLFDAIYAPQPIATRISRDLTRMQLPDSPPNNLALHTTSYLKPVPIASVYSGNAYAAIVTPVAALSARVRRYFTPLAYYSAHVRTDASGHAIASFTLPDDLTTWRVMAVALSRNGSDVGYGEASFISTKKLITNPLLPQFARPGDRIDGGISIRNATKSVAAAVVDLETSGALRFGSGDPTKQHVTASVDVGMQALRYLLVVGTPAPSTFTARSALGADTDAFEVPLAIRDRAVTQTSFDAGAVGAQVSIPINSTPGARLVLTLANSAVPQFTVPALDALKASNWPFADDASGRLIIDAMLKRSTSRDLATLISLQRSDGGFGFTPSDVTSDPFATAAALNAVAFAKKHGVAVSVVKVDAGLVYVRSILADTSHLTNCKDELCLERTRFEMLTVLAAWGDRQTTFLNDIIRVNQQFDNTTRMRLARYLLATPNFVSTGRQLAQHFLARSNMSGRFTTLNIASPWSWMGSQTQSQAQFVRLMVANGASRETLDASIRSLATMPCKCGWGGIGGTAAAMRALAAYQRVAVSHALNIDVHSGPTQLASVDLPTSPASKDVTLTGAALSNGKLQLLVRGGTLDYIMMITAPVPGDSPGAIAGLRITRTIKALGAKAPLATFDVSPLLTPLSVSAAQVYDIGLRIIVDRPLYRIAIEDPLPAGFEAIDSAFQTSPQAASEIADAWQIANRQIYADRVTAYASYLGPGVYEMHYLVHSVTPGTYRWPGARAYVRGAPEIFGRSASGVITITQ